MIMAEVQHLAWTAAGCAEYVHLFTSSWPPTGMKIFGLLLRSRGATLEELARHVC